MEFTSNSRFCYPWDTLCSPGSYCPTTTSKFSCNKGHYCWMGSLLQKQYFKLSTCNPNTANQNIHAYGALLLAALTAALLIIYNCSDQVLSTRERRQAKKREDAAKQVRETVQACERWKSAKDVAKKGAAGLQQSLSRTFSRRKSTQQPSGLKMFSTKTNTSDAQLSSIPLDSSNDASKAKTEQHKLTQMMNSIEDDPNSHQGFHLNIGSKHAKKQAAKDLHTKSQIFKYAYGQIEKEKAMQDANKNLTFSGVISIVCAKHYNLWL